MTDNCIGATGIDLRKIVEILDLFIGQKIIITCTGYELIRLLVFFRVQKMVVDILGAADPIR